MTRTRGRAPLFLAAVVLALAAAPPVAGAKTITGKLSKSGYTVLALARDGEAASDEAKGGKFKLRPPDKKVTLQLRDQHGKYAGAVVVGEKDKRTAIVGVKAGAELGKLKVRGGYAEATEELSPKAVDTKRLAKAKKGVPIGNGRNYGLVRTSATGSTGAGEDQDLDGVPGAFDVDDDGDLVLDNADRSEGAARAAQVTGEGEQLALFSSLELQLHEALNANAGPVSDEQVDAILLPALFLTFQLPAGDEIELDCGGLSYCSPGGTGRVGPISQVIREWDQPFPECCDADGDGFGTMSQTFPTDLAFGLAPRATSDRVGSGDAYIEHVTSGGEETELPTSLSYVFNTVPAVASWSDTAGDAGTFSYPVQAGDPGTATNPLSVGPGPTGDVIVSFTFWRPQRRAIPGAGEGSGFVDMGHLIYSPRTDASPHAPDQPPSGGPEDCPQDAITTSDPSLTPLNPPGSAHGFLVDSADDRAPSAANTLTFTVNLTQCFAARGTPWSSGQVAHVDVQARSESAEHANEIITFQLR